MDNVIRDCRTLIKIGYQDTTYTSGSGARTSFELIEVPIGVDEDTGKEITTDSFYCNWASSYGYMAIQQAEQGVNSPARVRMPYVKAVMDVLQSDSEVRIYKDGIIDDTHTYVLSTSAAVDQERRKMIEFQVKRYEEK